MDESNPFYSDSRWNNMYAYAQTLQDLVRTGGDPVEECITTLSLVLQQFPEGPPLDEDSHRVQCVRLLVRNVLGALREHTLDQARKEQK
ncbi:hypothetical protein SAMN02745704_00229 [Paucidesulfovibrio gracilis DSM 16080]|uniref:Uncharacterized protein n=1 Tax=Paucidesulfovibrio gracilis DSM 16080 TaxID=1121449 RepID=A0A1T4W3V9_9BACT|nr:hypothetical protein [Paucidesulfovibrio gracilis]SKA71877.1 hypothetical protein SAMN02745704_00229 [Paucidesulfovibrio gracilis DSM 16080]